MYIYIYRYDIDRENMMKRYICGVGCEAFSGCITFIIVVTTNSSSSSSGLVVLIY